MMALTSNPEYQEIGRKSEEGWVEYTRARSWLDVKRSSLITRRLSGGLVRTRYLWEFTVACMNKGTGMGGDSLGLAKLPFLLYKNIRIDTYPWISDQHLVEFGG